MFLYLYDGNKQYERLEEMNEAAMRGLLKTVYNTEGLHSLRIISSYRPLEEKGKWHRKGEYWDIGYLNEHKMNNGAGGGPPRLPTVAEPDIYKRFFQAHQRTPGKKQFLGPWRQNSHGINFNWGDSPGKETDPSHYHHIHIGYY